MTQQNHLYPINFSCSLLDILHSSICKIMRDKMRQVTKLGGKGDLRVAGLQRLSEIGGGA